GRQQMDHQSGRPVGPGQEAVRDQPPDQNGQRPRHVAIDQADRGRQPDAGCPSGETEASEAGPAVSRAISGHPTKATHRANEETAMKKIILAAAATCLAALLTPTEVDAYGAAHVGYTHVGPNGAYHVGETAVAGPGGVHGEEYRGGAVYGGENRGGAVY